MRETPFLPGKTPNHILSKIAFLLLSMPIGIFYFTVVVTGLSVGSSTFIIWVGIPILFVTFAFLWGMVVVERAMAASMLQVDIPASRPRYGHRSLQQQFKDYLRDPVMWKSLAYALFIKMPLGIFSFTLTVTVLAVALSLLLLPAAYLLLTFIYNAVGSHDPGWTIINIGSWTYIKITGQYDLVDFIKSFAFTIVGIPLWLLAIHVINWLAALNGVIMRAMLGPTDQMMEAPKDASYIYQPPQPRYNEGYQAQQEYPQQQESMQHYEPQPHYTEQVEGMQQEQQM